MSCREKKIGVFERCFLLNFPLSFFSSLSLLLFYGGHFCMNNFLHGVFFVSFTHVLLFLDTLRFSKWIYFQGCSGPLEGRGVL